MKETFEEFYTRVAKKRSCGRKFKVSGSWGAYNAYKALRKQQWLDIGRPLKEHEFYAIIRSMNNYIVEELVSGRKVILPARMGVLELRKFENGAYLIGGKLIVAYPIDWKATLQLWYEDKESYKNKTLVRVTQKDRFVIYYNKYTANYRNKKFYEFSINRKLRQKIQDRANKGQLDVV